MAMAMAMAIAMEMERAMASTKTILKQAINHTHLFSNLAKIFFIFARVFSYLINCQQTNRNCSGTSS
jgi:hypothetical protein